MLDFFSSRNLINKSEKLFRLKSFNLLPIVNKSALISIYIVCLFLCIAIYIVCLFLCIAIYIVYFFLCIEYLKFQNSKQKIHFFQLEHLKHNGNGITYPIRPYRSKDYMISSDSSTIYRHNPPLKSISTAEDEIISNRRSTLKETHLDHILNSTHGRSDGTMKTLLINRNRAIYSPIVPQQEERRESNLFPATMQRRSSFQTATQLNSVDFNGIPESFYFLDKKLVKPMQRNHHPPDRASHEYAYYREKRHDYSPYSKTDFNHQNSFVVKNQMLINEYLNTIKSNHDQKFYEVNPTNEYNRDNSTYNKDYSLNNNDRNINHYRDDGIFV